jgi:hypothetical protein
LRSQPVGPTSTNAFLSFSRPGCSRPIRNDDFVERKGEQTIKDRLKLISDDFNPAFTELRQHVETTAELIGGVHSLPLLPPIEIRFNLEPFRRGGYSPAFGGNSPQIALSILGISPRLTFAHEWGHYIDNAMSGFNGWASAEGTQFQGILEAIMDTKAYQLLKQERDPSPLRLTPERMEAIRLLDNTELWARAYAQYISLRSGDTRMGEELEARRADSREVHPALEYWEWNDFAPVAQEIDAWMQSKGWRL